MRRIGDRNVVTTTVMRALVIMAGIVLLSSTGCSGVPSGGSENRRGSASDSHSEQHDARSPSPEETRNTAPSAPANARDRGDLNPLVWGEGNVHVLGDRGTVRMRLDDVKRFESGVVLFTYLPAS